MNTSLYAGMISMRRKMNDVVVTATRINIPTGVIDGIAMVTHPLAGPTDFSRTNCLHVSVEAFIVHYVYTLMIIALFSQRRIIQLKFP